MSLVTKLENLQKRPEILKRRILFISLVVIMFVIVSIWVTTFKLSWEKDEQLQTASTPFAIMKSSARKIFRVPEIGASLLKNFYGEVYGAEK